MKLHFDIMTKPLPQQDYKFIHCHARWKKSPGWYIKVSVIMKHNLFLQLRNNIHCDNLRDFCTMISIGLTNSCLHEIAAISKLHEFCTNFYSIFLFQDVIETIFTAWHGSGFYITCPVQWTSYAKRFPLALAWTRYQTKSRVADDLIHRSAHVTSL